MPHTRSVRCSECGDAMIPWPSGVPKPLHCHDCLRALLVGHEEGDDVAADECSCDRDYLALPLTEGISAPCPCETECRLAEQARAKIAA